MRFDHLGVEPDQLGHAGVRIDRPPLRADGLRQYPPRRGLINHPAGLGFMPQLVTVEGGEFSVCAGLFVGHDHMSVQVRIPRPGGLVLVGRGHQTRQPLEVFFPGLVVVHAGVTSVLMNVFEGLAHARVVRLQDRFLHHVIAVRPQ